MLKQLPPPPPPHSFHRTNNIANCINTWEHRDKMIIIYIYVKMISRNCTHWFLRNISYTCNLLTRVKKARSSACGHMYALTNDAPFSGKRLVGQWYAIWDDWLLIFPQKQLLKTSTSEKMTRDPQCLCLQNWVPRSRFNFEFHYLVWSRFPIAFDSSILDISRPLVSKVLSQMQLIARYGVSFGSSMFDQGSLFAVVVLNQIPCYFGPVYMENL